MNLFIVIIVIIAIIAFISTKVTQKQDVTPTEFSYTKLDVLFTPAERSFLGVLNQAIGTDVQIFGKVRVADVITPKKGMSRSDWQKAFNKISSKHFDYLLCNKNDLSVLCAIELNDSSHNTKKRKDRDKLLEGACKSANLPLIQISAKATYNIQDIRQSIATYLPSYLSKNTDKEPIVSSTERLPKSIDKLCPKCSSAMVKKTTKKGKNIGSEFWACSAFPKCRHSEAII